MKEQNNVDKWHLPPPPPFGEITPYRKQFCAFFPSLHCHTPYMISFCLSGLEPYSKRRTRRPKIRSRQFGLRSNPRPPNLNQRRRRYYHDEENTKDYTPLPIR